MNRLASKAEEIVEQVNTLLSDEKKSEDRAMPCHSYFLDGGEILALPRDTGDSRYPYGRDGFNFWAYSSGYMHCNEGLFSHFLRSAEGQEPRIAFFAGLPEEQDAYSVIPLLTVPFPEFRKEQSIRRYSVLTMSAAFYVTELDGLRFVLRVSINPEKSVCLSLYMKNTSGTSQQFFVSSFINPYLRHQLYESGEDRWFKEIRALDPTPAQGELGSFLILVNEDKDRYHSVTHYGVIQRAFSPESGARLIRHEETTSRNQYVGGVRSSLHTPVSLEKGTFEKPQPLTTFVENAIAGDLLHIDLDAGSSARLDLMFSGPLDIGMAESRAAAVIDTETMDRQCEALAQEEKQKMGGLHAEFGAAQDARLKPDVFNAFFEHLKKQVEFCSLIKGYIQLSENSLIGIRDIFQALEGLLFWEPEPVKVKIQEALDYTALDGRCFRQYSLPSPGGEPGRMDLRPFIDQGVWVISTIATYLRVTGDTEFLNQVCGYHEIVDETARKVQKMEERDTVLDHLFKIMEFLLKNRDPKTKCVLALYGDWNDALDGLGISRDESKDYGTGVSVMAALQVYQNTQEMIEILEYLDTDSWRDRIDAYRRAGGEIADGLRKYAVVENDSGEKRIVHGWGDERSYFVGSFKDPDGASRYGLTSNAFWVLSGLYGLDQDLKDVILNAFENLDSKYGYKTFEPFFPPDTPGVGRIGKLPPGTAENGATYVHATGFAVMALFQMGRPKEGWEQLVKILPFTDLHENLSHSPFVMPNAYGYNPEKNIDGQNMNDWQTGSSNVLLKLLIRFVFGFEPTLEGIWVQPAAWIPFKTFDFQIDVRGTAFRIQFFGEGTGQRSFKMNGEQVSGEHDAVMGIDKLWIPYEVLKKGPVDIQVRQ